MANGAIWKCYLQLFHSLVGDLSAPEFQPLQLVQSFQMIQSGVGDFTGQKNGVYFEAGFAKGLSLEIIWMVRADDLKNCHFNTEHFNHITWKPNDDKLSERVTNRIIATIGQGPLNPE